MSCLDNMLCSTARQVLLMAHCPMNAVHISVPPHEFLFRHHRGNVLLASRNSNALSIPHTTIPLVHLRPLSSKLRLIVVISNNPPCWTLLLTQAWISHCTPSNVSWTTSGSQNRAKRPLHSIRMLVCLSWTLLHVQYASLVPQRPCWRPIWPSSQNPVKNSQNCTSPLIDHSQVSVSEFASFFEAPLLCCWGLRSSSSLAWLQDRHGDVVLEKNTLFSCSRSVVAPVQYQYSKSHDNSL